MLLIIYEIQTGRNSNISQETIENELNILQDKGLIEQRGDTVSKSFFILQRPQIFIIMRKVQIRGVLLLMKIAVLLLMKILLITSDCLE